MGKWSASLQLQLFRTAILFKTVRTKAADQTETEVSTLPFSDFHFVCICNTDWTLNIISKTFWLEQSYRKTRNFQYESSIPPPPRAKLINSIIIRKFSFTEATAYWLPLAFWGNSWRMFRPQRFYTNHVISRRAWLADKNKLVVNKLNGNFWTVYITNIILCF